MADNFGRSAVAIPQGVSSLLDELDTRVAPDRASRVCNAITRLFDDALVRLNDDTVFVLTGDIPAMWLRDSTWQLRPLLAAAADPETYELIAAVSRRQAAFVLIDAYANAFNADPNGNCWHKDFVDQSPWVFERKYELDSLAAFLDLALRLYRASGRADHLDAHFVTAAAAAVDVMAREQTHDPDSYRFIRVDAPSHDHLSHDGYGAPVAPTGMSWSGFRPSDDACTYGYLVPANAHAAVVLEQLAALPGRIAIPDALRDKCVRIASEIREGIAKYAVVDANSSQILAYEVDGHGGSVLMDDANVPSLLSLPYLGWCDVNDSLYSATRAWVLSSANPWYASGSHAAGIGSPHTPEGHVWPIAVAMAGLTSRSPSEVEECLQVLESTDAGTGNMHESFNCDDPCVYTRPWFSWADMTYAHLVLRSAGLAFD